MNKQISLIVLGVLALVSVGGGLIYMNQSQSDPVATTIDALLAKITPDELVKQSSGVVLGTVTNLEVAKIPSYIRPGEGNEDIVTRATIKVEKYLNNPERLASDTVTVQVIGGTLGNESMSAEESPSFKIGDRVVVFLNKKDESTYSIYGWAQGKYTVDANDTVAVGEEESFFLRDVFGKEHMSLAEFESMIASSVSRAK